MREPCHSLRCKSRCRHTVSTDFFPKPELPDVLHNLSFTINPGEKVNLFPVFAV
jgi:hypothetical protein